MKKIRRFWNYLKWHFYWKYEVKKCLKDPYYLYHNYFRIKGKNGKLLKLSKKDWKTVMIEDNEY